MCICIYVGLRVLDTLLQHDSICKGYKQPFAISSASDWGLMMRRKLVGVLIQPCVISVEVYGRFIYAGTVASAVDQEIY